MGEVHRLIETHGRQGALQFIEDRRVVDIAADYLADEDTGLGFTAGGRRRPSLTSVLGTTKSGKYAQTTLLCSWSPVASLHQMGEFPGSAWLTDPVPA